jgi:putative ABC transport system permease protein
MKYVPLILRNLARNRRRNILTALSVAVSLFIFVALASVPDIVNQMTMSDAADRLVTTNKAGIFYMLPEVYRQKIEAIPHVVAVSGETFFGGSYQDPREQLGATSLDIDQLTKVYPDFDISPAAMTALKREKVGCLVGGALMHQYHWHIGESITLKGTIYPVNVELKIVGTLGHKFPTFLVMRRDYLNEILPNPGWYNDIWIRLDSPAAAASVIAAVDETFANSSYETRTEHEATFIQNFLGMVGPLFQLTAALSVVVLIVIGLVAANTAAMSIRERRNEMAVMRALGFSNRAMVAMVVSENIVIGLAGAALGCAGAYLMLASGLFGSTVLGGIAMIRPEPQVLAEGIAMGALIGLLGAAVPALAAMRRGIVDALRAVA